MSGDTELDLIATIRRALVDDRIYCTIVPVWDEGLLTSVAWCAEQAARLEHVDTMRFMTQLRGDVYDVRVVDLTPVLTGDEIAATRLDHRLDLVEDYHHQRPWPPA